jgi:hypothetical protein
MGPFPYLDGAIGGAREQIRCFSKGFVKIDKIELDPAIFLKLIKISVPRNAVDYFVMGLDIFYNLKFTVVDSYGAVRETDCKETLNLAGIKV